MASRTWLAVLLAMFVWYAYLQWFAPPPATPPKTPTQSAGTTTSAAAPTAPVTTGWYGASFQPAPVHKVGNGKLDVGFSDVGGKIGEIALNQYKEHIHDNSPPIRTIDPEHTPLALSTVFTDATLLPLTN